MDTIEALDRKGKLALTALQEKLTDAKKYRPEMLGEITIIESALESIEDLDKYIERFNELEVVVDAFMAEARGGFPTPRNVDRLNRLKNVRDGLNVYKHAYANYAVELPKKGD